MEQEQLAPQRVSKQRFQLRELTVIGLLAGITVMLGISGYGLIPLGAINVTTLHIPALLGAIIEGPKVGAFVGLLFGIYSFWQNINAPTLLSPLFLNPLISVLPRVIFPIIAYLIYKAVAIKNETVRIFIAAFLGTVCHTAMVMSLIYFIYGVRFAELLHIEPVQVLGVVLGICATNGIPEAVLAGVIVTPIAMAVRKSLRK